MGCKLVDTKNENSNICNMFLKKEKKLLHNTLHIERSAPIGIYFNCKT